MRDARPQLIKALVSDLKSRLSYDRVYTKIPKKVSYPYVYIAEIYQDEDGSKSEFQYRYDVLIQVVYKDADSPLARYQDQSAILGMVNNAQGFALEDNFDLMKVSLISNSEETDIKTDSGILDVGLVRIEFLIEDLQ